MSQQVLFVSVNKSYRSGMSVAEMEPCVERAWAMTVAKAAACDRVCAVFEGSAYAAWRLRGAFPTSETFQVADGSTRPRIGLALGEPLPVLPAYQVDPSLRRGVAIIDLDVAPLPKVIKPGAESADTGDNDPADNGAKDAASNLLSVRTRNAHNGYVVHRLSCNDAMPGNAQMTHQQVRELDKRGPVKLCGNCRPVIG